MAKGCLYVGYIPVKNREHVCPEGQSWKRCQNLDAKATTTLSKTKMGSAYNDSNKQSVYLPR
jgi:hypothetical protein